MSGNVRLCVCIYTHTYTYTNMHTNGKASMGILNVPPLWRTMKSQNLCIKYGVYYLFIFLSPIDCYNYFLSLEILFHN